MDIISPLLPHSILRTRRRGNRVMAQPMHRRSFLTLLGTAAAAWPVVARAQQDRRVRRVGILASQLAADDPEWQARSAAFIQGLQQLGWTSGRNLRLDFRFGLGDPDG